MGRVLPQSEESQQISTFFGMCVCIYVLNIFYSSSRCHSRPLPLSLYFSFVQQKCYAKKPNMNNILSYLSTKPNDLFMGTVHSGEQTLTKTFGLSTDCCNNGCVYASLPGRYVYMWSVAIKLEISEH